MSTWKDFVTAALLGTEQGAPPSLPAALEPVAASSSDLERDVQFLTRAGALALWRRAGWMPPTETARPVAAEAETTASVSRESAGHLRIMLGGHHPALIREWLEEAARRQRRLPPELLPALLDRARQDRTLRPLVLAAGGKRAAWLAAHHPEWSFATIETPELWETGSRDQRVGLLRNWRATAPAEARTRLEAVWKTEPAENRTAFLQEFAANLSIDDAPFLDAALDDRSKEVRRVAVDLLARLPASDFASRMLARSAGLLEFKRGGLLLRATLEVTLPAEADAAGVRDGLDPKTFGTQKTLGDKAALLLLLLAAIPLRHWTEMFGQPPAALLTALEKSEFARAVATGWAWAALRQRNAAWAEALLDGPISPFDQFLPSEPLLSVLPEAARAIRLTPIAAGSDLRKPDVNAWQTLSAQLQTFAGPWPLPLGRAVLDSLRHGVANGLPWQMRGIAEALLLRLPAALLPDAQSGWPTAHESAAALIELVTFRRDALNALQTPKP